MPNSISKLKQPLKLLKEFIQLESASGIILFAITLFALILDNSPWQTFYQHLFSSVISLKFWQWQFNTNLTLCINDGLMAVFFLLVGLEIKREILVGELNSTAKVILPALAALGGMVVPALIYVAFNYHDITALRGWAIPTATDIAFALAIMSLLGKRLPLSLKLFLMALAIFDDIGAIIIIAVFYLKQIAWLPLLLAIACFAILMVFNRLGIKRLLPYLLVGLLLWLCVLFSGIHATIAGVLLAFTIPLRLIKLEQALHPWVAYAILPLFALANAGVSFTGMEFSHLLNPVTLGIIAGLVLGKQMGIMATTWLAIRCKWANMPVGANWLSLYGTALVCGVGFTMSLLIGALAFEGQASSHTVSVRLGVLTGSLLSGLLGYSLLHIASRRYHNKV